MRQWTYSWASSDGLRHEGEIFAPSKDDAYAQLRKQGIRPIRVTERIVPVVRRGFKGLRKRDIVCIVVVALTIAAIAWIVATQRTRHSALSTPQFSSHSALEDVSPEMLAVSPEAREQLKRAIEERKAIEQKCREDFIERVKKGTMTKEAANEMFRAMGMEELK